MVVSVRRSVGPSVPRYFQTPKDQVFERGKSSNVIIMLNNDTMSDDEVVASYVPPRYLFHLRSFGSVFTSDFPCLSPLSSPQLLHQPRQSPTDPDADSFSASRQQSVDLMSGAKPEGEAKDKEDLFASTTERRDDVDNDEDGGNEGPLTHDGLGRQSISEQGRSP